MIATPQGLERARNVTMTTAAYFRQLLAPLFDCPECNGRKVVDYSNSPPMRSTPVSRGDVVGAEVRREPCRMCKGTGTN